MSHGRRSRKKQHHEEHENHERWLVSYADMVTLLMCLFIVLFAISAVDQKKFSALSSGLAESFGAPVSAMDDGAVSNDPAVDGAAPAPVNLQQQAQIDGAKQPNPQQAAVESEIQRRRNEAVQRSAQAAYAEFAALRAAINTSLRKAGYPNAAHYEVTERGLVVSITTDHVLFDSASAALKPAGVKILDAVAPPLRRSTKPLAIEGHTNQLRLLPGSGWPSDWELSAYRATTVLRHLATVDSLPQKRMYAAAYGHTRPLIDPALPASVTRNRRVDIVVLSDASTEVNALLPGLDAAAHHRS